MIITIDGPAGAGKSSIAKLLAKKLGFKYLDTGAFYRAYTLSALQNGFIKKQFNKKKFLSYIETVNINISFRKDNLQIFLNGKNVSTKIRENEVSKNVFHLAEDIRIRKKVNNVVRQLVKKLKNVVTEGRDQGSVVFPDADFKFYLWASPEERARRRLKDLKNLGEKKSFIDVLYEINKRDKRDMSRKYSPLKKTSDMIFVDSTNLTKTQVVDFIMKSLNVK